MASLLSLIPVIGSALGGLFGNTQGARTSTSSSTITPGENPQVAGIGSMLRSMYAAKLGAPTPLAGYSANGLQSINDTFAGIKQNSDNSLTARGLASSPMAATADTNINTARGSQMASFLNNLPLLQRQMQNEDLSSASNFYNAQPRPMTQNGTNVGAGSAAAGAFSSAATMLAYLQGKGMLGGGSGGGSGSGSSGLSIGDITGAFG